MYNFTPRAQQVLSLARKEAVRFNHNYIGTEHILLGLLINAKGIAVVVLEKMGLNVENIRLEVERQVGVGAESKSTGDIPYTPRVKKVLSLAGKEAKALNHNYIGTEHLLLGLLREGEGVAAKVLKNANLDVDQTRNEILLELDPNFESKETESTNTSQQEYENHVAKKEIKTPNLKAFGRDLTEMARKGELDPVIGRETEIERVIQVLCRRTKNNPVLIGEAGVGKTAVVEGLAHEICSGNVPKILKDKKVITLDLALMVAGTKYRGQFEERIKAVMDEIYKTKNVILFIDELHTLVGAGAAEGAMDASNIIKPALSRGELQCVGATTINEFRKHIEKDSALERRFQQVKVDAPSVEQTISILKGLREKYEQHHNARYSDLALEAAARLSDRYLTGRFLPDKAIDIMDEAGARARISEMNHESNSKKLEKRIEEIYREKDNAIKSQDFKLADILKKEEKKLKDQLKSLHKTSDEKVVDVSEEDMMNVISKWTGIPLTKMNKTEAERLLRMEDELKESVIGQEEAVIAISKALRRSRADLKDPKRPIGSFMFLGPTGVGKTFLTQCLAEYMFGDKDSLIQIDMSEYMEKFNTSRLIGSPPGYVGHEEGGQLSEAVRKKPYSVILFDEIEKAHPDVMYLLLQILEEGKITDSLGRKIDFRNTIIILTTNIGANLVKKEKSMGFNTPPSDDSSYDEMHDRILEEAKKVLKPEFVNRLDDLIVFHPLEKKELSKIVDLEIKKVTKRLVNKRIKIDLDDSAKEFLIQKGYDPAYGARPMRRAVERHLEDQMAEEILKGNIKEDDQIKVSMLNNKLTFEKL